MISDTDLMNIAMEIIISAGDARLHIKEALDEIIKNEYVIVEKKMKEAKDKITLAHSLQTDIIQREANGDKIQYLTLFNHAQDTLMTINSEFMLVKQLSSIFESYEKRIADLEGKR